MKLFFIFYAFVLLASCQKEAIQSTVTHTPLPQMMETNAAKTLIPGGPVSSGRFTLTFTPVIPIGSAELQFTCSIGCYPMDNIPYLFNDSITAKEYIQYGLTHIRIDVQKDPHTYQINIIGDSTQISPGTYPYVASSSFVFAPNSAMFLQQAYDYEIIEQDFSLRVLSYENGYLDATFYSSRISNGTKITLKS